MNVKQLIEKLGDKSPFRLAWAIMWRQWIIMLVAYLIGMFFFLFFLAIIL